MATRKLGTKVEVDGEKEFKQAMSGINAELKKVEAQYLGNANSAEALAAKNEVLRKKLEEQREHVEKLRQRYQEFVKTYGEADERTRKLAVSLTDAETAALKTEHAIQQNTEAIDKANDSSQSLITGLTDLAGQFGVRLPSGVDKALQSMSGFSAGSVAALGGVALAA